MPRQRTTFSCADAFPVPRYPRLRRHPGHARVEKVANGAFFRAIWPYRAITPVDGWYEWVDEGGAKKQPSYLRRRDGQPALCVSIGQFAGREDDGVVILTADSLGGLLDVHDRRPVVFCAEHARTWLAPTTRPEQAEQMALNLAEGADAFEWYRVGLAPDLNAPI